MTAKRLVDELLDRVKQLETKVKELEAKPPQIMSYPIYVPYPHYVYPQIYHPAPYQPFWYGGLGAAQCQSTSNYQQSANSYAAMSYSGSTGSING